MEDKTEPSENQKDNTRDEKGRFKPGFTPDTAFKPGQSGNPAGRPKDELCITPSLRAILDEVPGEEDGIENPKGKTYLELWIRRWAKRLVEEGDPRLSQQVLDRLEGPVTQLIQASVQAEQMQAATELLGRLSVNREKISIPADEGQGEIGQPES